ncbi:MAG TPA: hypothetical protein VK550_28710 [Polyangiaceae bacterium]|jgi:hypothetical protein|nr:hypothetical protein [Polyangiaceae bacterium]
MWLDAIVTSADLQNVVDQLTPATVPLGTRGHLFFDAPAEVSLVAERGLRVRCHAKLSWPVLGIDVGITIRSMTVVVVPSIESRDGERVIVFSPEVDALDLALLPDIGDAEVRSFINRELQAKRIELPWNYKQTLDHQFPLPDWFRSGAMFDIKSNGAAVKVTNDSVGVAIDLTASIQAVEPASSARPAQPGGGPSGAEANGSNGINGVGSSPKHMSPTALAVYQRRRRLVGIGVAIAGGFGIGCLVGMRHADQ